MERAIIHMNNGDKIEINEKSLINDYSYSKEDYESFCDFVIVGIINVGLKYKKIENKSESYMVNSDLIEYISFE